MVHLLRRAARTPATLTGETLRRAREKGVYRNPSHEGYQEGRYFSTDSLKTLFSGAGLHTIDILSIMGFAADHAVALFELQRRAPGLFSHFMDLLDETSRDPDVISFGKLAMWIGAPPMR